MKDENTVERIFIDVKTEIERAESKFPSWPEDPRHALCILSEEYGELCQAVQNKAVDNYASVSAIRKEAEQTAAMAIRFLYYLEQYRWDETRYIIED